MQVDISTIYRWARQGKLTTEKIDGVLHVVTEDDKIPTEETKTPEQSAKAPTQDDDYDLVAELKERIAYLERENEAKSEIIKQMQQDAEAARERSDTIILQFTQQLSEQTKLLEDMRQENEQKKGLFKRLFRRD